MAINMVEWQRQVILEKVKKPSPLLLYPALSLMDVSLGELLHNSSYLAEAMRIIVEKADPLISVGVMDLSVEAEAFGAEIKEYENEVPTVKGALITDIPSAEALRVPEVNRHRTKVMVEACSLAKKVISDRPVLGGILGPFSLGGRLLDVNKALVYTKKNPELLHLTLQKVCEFLIDYGGEFKKAGADGVFIAEPLAGLISPKMSEEFSGAYIKKIVDFLQDESFSVFYHNCGDAAGKMTESIVNTGVRAIHFGNKVNMKEVMDLIPHDILVMGNIDPAACFVNGTPEIMRACVRALLDSVGSYNNFILSSGCDVPHTAGFDIIHAFYHEAEKWQEEYS